MTYNNTFRVWYHFSDESAAKRNWRACLVTAETVKGAQVAARNLLRENYGEIKIVRVDDSMDGGNDR